MYEMLNNATPYAVIAIYVLIGYTFGTMGFTFTKKPCTIKFPIDLNCLSFTMIDKSISMQVTAPNGDIAFAHTFAEQKIAEIYKVLLGEETVYSTYTSYGYFGFMVHSHWVRHSETALTLTLEGPEHTWRYKLDRGNKLKAMFKKALKK